MRILALNWRCLRHPQAGGGEINLFEQTQRWNAQGHDVTVLCSDPGRAVAPMQDEVMAGALVRRRGGRFGVYLRTALFLLSHGREYDRILDVSNGIPFFAPLFTATPVTLLVHHVHDRQWFSEFPAPLAVVGRFLERRVVPAVYHRRPVVTVSPTTRDGLLRLGYRAEQIHVVFNGVELPERARLAPPRVQRLLYLGRLKRYKRVDLLVRAVATLRAHLADVHLDIAGDGDARPGLEALVRELGLQNHVTIHGFVDDATKDRLLRTATVFANPSMHEGWGISVVEANAWGCPAVAFDVPGLSAAIRHGETGLLIPDGDQDAFARALEFFLTDPVARSAYGAAARRWAEGFSWNTAARQTLEVLQGAGPHALQAQLHER